MASLCSLTHSLVLLFTLCALTCIHCQYMPSLANGALYTGVVRPTSLLINKPVCYPGIESSGTATLYYSTADNEKCSGNNTEVTFKACNDATTVSSDMVYTVQSLKNDTDYWLTYFVLGAPQPCSGTSGPYRTKKVEDRGNITTWLGKHSASMVVITSILTVLLVLLLIAFIMMFFVKWETGLSEISQQVRPQLSEYSKYDTHHINTAYEEPSQLYVKA
uniref:uroplakin-3b n=1 Tax=Myxine glutinosa TaxID=7769 RepID=UPI00358E686F